MIVEILGLLTGGIIVGILAAIIFVYWYIMKGGGIWR